MSWSTKIVTIAVVTAFLAVAPLKSQNNAGSISGVVQDAQGAVVPSAKVTLTNDNQGAGSARTASTNGVGAFSFSPVLPGTYTVTVEVHGFQEIHPVRASRWT